MESVVERGIADSAEEVEVSKRQLEDVRLKAQAYLRAWRLPEAPQEELLAEAMLAARCHFARGGVDDPITGVMRELEERVRQTLGSGATEEDRLVMLLGCRDEAKDLLRQALYVHRPRETHLTEMRTSLSRLPSFRIIAGWFTIILLLFLTFIFTH